MSLQHRGALAAVIVASSTVFLDGSIVNIALPRLGAELPATNLGVLEGQTYVVAGYMAALAAFLLPGGAIGDLYGRRRAYLFGLTAFGLASMACGASPTLDLLVVARLVQGVAGAILIPGSLAIITALYDGRARAQAFGIWTTATSAVVLLGPPIGGFLIETAGWRSIFLINVPLIAVALAAAARSLPELRAPGPRPRFDWPGTATAAVAIGGLSFGAIRGQETGWAQTSAIIALAVGLVALVAFPVLMARRRDPLVPLSLFRNTTFSAINLVTLLVYGALYLMLYLQSLFLQGVLDYTPLAAALATLPMGLALVLLSARAGVIAVRIGTRPFVAAGPLTMAAGALLWLRVAPTAAPWLARLDRPGSLVPPTSFLTDVLPPALLMAIGISILVVPLTTTLMGSIPVERAGLGSAINNALSRVGQPIFAAIAFILVTGQFYASTAARVPGLNAADPGLRAIIQPLNAPATGTNPAVAAAAAIASTEAFHTVALVAAVLLGLGALVGLRGVPASFRVGGPAPTASGTGTTRPISGNPTG